VLIAHAIFLLEHERTYIQTHKLKDATESPNHTTMIATGIGNNLFLSELTDLAVSTTAMQIHSSVDYCTVPRVTWALARGSDHGRDSDECTAHTHTVHQCQCQHLHTYCLKVDKQCNTIPLKSKSVNNKHTICSTGNTPSVLWRCWMGSRKGIRPVKNWVVGCWRGCLGWGADLHIVQQIGF